MAKKIKLDSGYTNAFMPIGMRGRMSNYGSEMMAGNALLPQTVLQSAYIHNGFARIICDTPAEEMTRAGFDIEGLSEDLEQEINSVLEELDASKHFNEAIKWRNAFGGGLIVLGLDDGGELSEPLNEDNLNTIDFMRVYDSFEAYAYSRYDDPKESKYGKIETWQVSPKSGGSSYVVHETRVLVLDGESVPNDVRVSNNGWGASKIQNCFVQLVRLDTSYKWALLLLERMQQAVHGIPNLSDQVSTPEGEALVTKRVNVVDTVRSALNTVVIDAEETYTINSLSLTGVKDIVETNAEALGSVAHMPTFIIMGRTVGGLGGNGESSQAGWHAQVESWQNDQYKKPLDRLISLIILCKSDGETDGGKYTIKFNPLYTLNAKEKAEVDLKKEQTKKAEMDTIMVAVNGGLMDQDEARNLIREEYDLVGDAPEPEPAQAPDPLILNEGQRIVPHPNAPKALPVGKTKKIAGKAK